MAAGVSTVDVFVNPTGMFDRLVLLTGEAIVIANPDASSLAKITPASGVDPRAIGDARIVPYAAIRKVSTNKHGDTISIRYTEEAKPRLVTVTLKDAATRDQAWDRLRRRIGKGFSFSDVQFGVARAAVAPLVTIAVFAFLTWLFYGAAVELAAGVDADIHGRNAALKRIAVFVLELIGPTGVVIAGGLAVLIAGWWGAQRVRVPPRLWTLAR